MSPYPTYEEKELLLRIAKGDRKAFEQLFNDHYPRLVVFTERFTENRNDAEDIVSEAFTKFWLIRERFEVLNQIKSFLYLSSRNAALNLLRKRKNQPTIAFTGQEPFLTDRLTETEALRAEIIGTLFAEIERLPDKYKEIILLTYREKLNTKQIAERLSITVSNVTTLRSRATQLLKISLMQQYLVLFPLGIGDMLRQLFPPF